MFATSMRHLCRIIVVGIAINLPSQVVPTAKADVSLPRIFGDHMVLQAEQPVPIWGKATPGEAVVVRFGAHETKATANKQGRWQVKLPALAPSFEPQTLSVAGNNEVLVRDVLVGEVWFASGQSNMEWSLARSDGGQAAISASADDGLRLFHVGHAKAGRA